MISPILDIYGGENLRFEDDARGRNFGGELTVRAETLVPPGRVRPMAVHLAARSM